MGLSDTLPNNITVSPKSATERGAIALEKIALRLELNNELTKIVTAQQQEHHEAQIRLQCEWLDWNKNIYQEAQKQREADSDALKDNTAMLENARLAHIQTIVNGASETRMRLEMLEREYINMTAHFITLTSKPWKTVKAERAKSRKKKGK